MEISVGRPKSKRTLVGLALASSLIGPVWADTFTGPVGKYYLDNLSNSTIYVVQGTSVVESFPMAYSSAYGEGVLAVSETIRTRARYILWGEDLAAGEYTLSGNPTGHGYSTPRVPYSAFSVYDGTSDGTYNYFVDHNGGMADEPGSGGVYRTDYYWQDPELLFYPRFLCPDYQFGCQAVTGISYDPTNNSLWISSMNPWIADYSLSRVLLAAFDTRMWDYRIYPPGFAGYNAALALDPADHTLWLTTGGSNLLRQYSLDRATFGDLLQMGTPSGLPGGFYESGEFRDAAPEPATFVLLLPVIALIGFRIRSHARLSP